jgi:hypothetical protein
VKQHSLPLTGPVRVMSSMEVERLIAQHRAEHGTSYLTKIPRARWLEWARAAWESGHREVFAYFMRRARSAS